MERQILEVHDLAEDSSRQANLEAENTNASPTSQTTNIVFIDRQVFKLQIHREAVRLKAESLGVATSSSTDNSWVHSYSLWASDSQSSSSTLSSGFPSSFFIPASPCVDKVCFWPELAALPLRSSSSRDEH